MNERRLGSIYGFTGGSYAGLVYDKNFLAPSLNAMQGGNRQPMIIDDTQGFEEEPRIYSDYAPCLRGSRSGLKIVENLVIGGMQKNQSVKTDGCCTCLTSSMGMGGGYTPMIVAMRGRYTDENNSKTMQKLEPNKEGLCNTLTSVQKDNLVMESVVLGGLGEKKSNGGTQYYQQDRVYSMGDVAMCHPSQIPGGSYRYLEIQTNPVSTSEDIIERTNMTGFNADNGVLSTYSPYVNKKYEEFIEENGHIPEFFNPYNKSEITDIAPTLTAQGDSITKSGTVLKCDMQYRIRKLTPKECWRLMGFTDEDFMKAEMVNSNTQLYKQAGNSIVKDVLMAIFEQMM